MKESESEGEKNCDWDAYVVLCREFFVLEYEAMMRTRNKKEINKIT